MPAKNKIRVVIKDLPRDETISTGEMKAVFGGVMTGTELDQSFLTVIGMEADTAGDYPNLRKRPGRVK